MKTTPKFLPAIFTLLLLFQSLSSQDKTGRTISEFKVGYSLLFNTLNGNNYYSFMSGLAPYRSETVMTGIEIEFQVPSSVKNISWNFGTTIMIGADQLGATHWAPGNTSSSDYTQNGGGVYGGMTVSLGGEILSFTSDFNVGVFSFKEYVGIFDSNSTPAIEVFDKMASHGLGAKTSIGLQLKFGHFGINPSADLVFSGGSNTSFLYYGATLPFVYSF